MAVLFQRFCNKAVRFRWFPVLQLLAVPGIVLHFFAVMFPMKRSLDEYALVDLCIFQTCAVSAFCFEHKIIKYEKMKPHLSG